MAMVVTAAAVAGVYLLTRAAQAAGQLSPGAIGAGVGAGIVNAGTGLVQGVGDAVGLPRTNMDDCRRAMAEGRTWDASMVCPAPIFLDYLVSPKDSPPSTGGASGGW